MKPNQKQPQAAPLPCRKILSKMSPRSHWPDRPKEFDVRDSEVVKFIRSKGGGNWSQAMKIFCQAKDERVIVFDRGTRLWRGNLVSESRAKVLVGLYSHRSKRRS